MLWPLPALVVLVGVWALLARAEPASILPGPAAVWSRFVEAWRDGTYLTAVGVTAQEAALGWVVGVTAALPLGYLIGRWRALEGALAPYLAASQAMPVVAIAPLLVVWLGLGLEPKVVIAALIAFFPVTTTTASGMRGIGHDLRDVARVFGANWWQTLIYLDLPQAARAIFAGAKISAALAVTGAVVGEFISQNAGLGSLVMLGETNFDTPLMFVALISLMILGATAYGLLSLVESVVLRWTE